MTVLYLLNEFVCNQTLIDNRSSELAKVCCENTGLVCSRLRLQHGFNIFVICLSGVYLPKWWMFCIIISWSNFKVKVTMRVYLNEIWQTSIIKQSLACCVLTSVPFATNVSSVVRDRTSSLAGVPYEKTDAVLKIKFTAEVNNFS